MRRRRFFRRLSAGWSEVLSGWWTNVRFYWYTGSKGTWIFALTLGFIVTSSVYLMYSFVTKYPDKQELTCLSLNVYFEARGEPLAGQRAVAEVTMNRVASKHYPNTVCDVVYEKKWDRLRKREVSAFSWTEFDSRPLPEGKPWDRAQRAAMDVYYGRTERTLEGATLYHSVHIRPSWARGVKPVARIGRHLFYNKGRIAPSRKRKG